MNARKAPANLTASVHQRLLNLAQHGEGDFQTLLIRYGLERLLYRVSRTEQGHHFILKGALAFCLWGERLHRATRDLDFLGSGESSAAYFSEFFHNLCHVEVEEDGIRLVEESIRVRQMREDEEYAGIRVELMAKLGNARIPIQIDIGFGDVVRRSLPKWSSPLCSTFPGPACAPMVKASLSLADVVPVLRDFLLPPALALVAGQPFARVWPAGGPWQEAEQEK